MTICPNCEGSKFFPDMSDPGYSVPCNSCGGKGVIECLDGPDGCSGPVEFRSMDGYKAWPRCEKHFDERLKKQEHINELTSDTPASWFDESYAGERWDDDY